MVKTLIRIGINTLIGAVLIYFWLKLVNIQEILDVLETFNPWILIPCAGFMVLATVLKAIRFKVLLSKALKVPALKIINLTLLSQLLSYTIPIRAGEIAKGVYLSTEYNLHFGKSLVWVFLDRFLDFWAVLGFSLILLLIVPTGFPQGLIQTLFWVVVAASAGVVLVVLKPEFFRGLAKLISKILIAKALKDKFLSFSFFIIDCFGLLKGSVLRNLKLFFLTTAAVVSEGLTWYFIFSFLIPGVSLLKILLGSMLTALTFLIPAAPGYVGSAEAAGLAVFSYGLGLSQSIVPAATVIIHAVGLVVILSAGIIGLYALKFDLGLVWRKVLKKG
jgi:uncharacterized protein (TIRG00374 family)